MKVIDEIKKADKTLFSFELLPPLKGSNIDKIYAAIDPLLKYNPTNIYVTYHQQEVVYKRRKDNLLEKQTVRKRPGTVAISAAIRFKYPNINVVPHIICGGFSTEETENALIDLNFLGFSNVLALRGDPPKTQRYFTPEPDGHSHTDQLVKQIVNINNGRYIDEKLQNTSKTNFCIGVAGYPEKHFESPNIVTDLKYLKQKVDAGADYIITQMFFDNQKYYDFVNICRDTGINVPIIPGIKPIVSKRDIEVLPQIFNIDIPFELVEAVENAKDLNAVKQTGIEWAVKQSKELMKFGVPVIHYYTIGKSESVEKICAQVF